MDLNVLRDIAIEVPALAFVTFALSYVFLQILKIILDKLGRQLEQWAERQSEQFAKQAELMRELMAAVDSMGQRCALINQTQTSKHR